MLISLRSRLWLSYALLIVLALLVVGIVLFSFLIANPLAYRQTSQIISQVEKSLVNRQSQWSSLPVEQMRQWLERAAQVPTVEDSGIRVLVFNARRDMFLDSMAERSLLYLPKAPRLRSNGIIRDVQGSPWLYSVIQLENKNWLMVAAARPDVPLYEILRDELFAPIIRAGLVALFFSLVLAFVMARWIGDPLQRLVTVSQQVPDVKTSLPEGGPREVRDLVHAYKEMLNRVQTSQKSQRDFVANVSHEMKTPLTSIQGFAQAILDGTAATQGEIKRASEIIFTEAGRLHRLVVDLLDLARLDAGTANFEFKQVDLFALMESVRDRFALRARELDIDLVVQPGQIPTIRGDGDRLAQVLTNLVDNALRYTRSGGTVTLSAQVESNAVAISVSDTGEGISQADLEHIFERFYRADSSRRRNEDPGAGLGLSIAQEIAIMHGGTLIARSQEGKGSIFTLKLPIAQSASPNTGRRRMGSSGT